MKAWVDAVQALGARALALLRGLGHAAFFTAELLAAVPASLRLLSRRTKRSMTRSRSPSGTPGPVSVTEYSISPDERRRARSITAPPVGVYLMALSMMLARAWARKG